MTVSTPTTHQHHRNVALHLPHEILLKMAHNIRNDHGGHSYRDFNSFLKVNCVLYNSLNPILWKKAAENPFLTRHVLAHLIKTSKLARLECFLELGAETERGLAAFNITGIDNLKFNRYIRG
jgi:hypothetical protein